MPTIHRMDRRSSWKNYELPGIYHITIKAAEALRTPFGKVVGDIDKPDGDADAPRVALSPVGEMVKAELLHSISAHYPMVEVQDHVIMPEPMHFIVKVTRTIVNSEGRSAHLGMVIAGYKKGCNRRYWELTGQQGKPTGEPTGGTCRHGRKEPAEEPLETRASAGRLARPEKRPPSNGTSGRQPLFQEGYCDVMPIDAAQLEQQRAYIKGNPRSRLMRSSNRAWLQPQRGGVDTALTVSALRGYLQRECAPSQVTAEGLAVIEGRLLKERRTSSGTAGNTENAVREVITYGDRKLLERRLLPVVCHRKDARLLAKQHARCLEEAERGAVLISPRIAKGEQAIIDEAVNRGYATVLIADNGFPEVYHPSVERIERCAKGKLLIVTPWEYHDRRSDEDICIAECKTMNCVAQALSRTRDDWWENRLAVKG